MPENENTENAMPQEPPAAPQDSPAPPQEEADTPQEPSAPEKAADRASLAAFAMDVLTAVAIALVVGLVGFSALTVYSTVNYRAQIAEVQAQNSAASSPALSGYAYAGPNGTHRPDSWPEPTAQASSRVEVQTAAPTPQPSQQETSPAETPTEEPSDLAPDPEPAEPADSSDGGAASADSNSSNDNGQSGGGAAASSDESPTGSSSSGGSSGNADNFNAHYNPDQQQTTAQYVLNTSTKKFHIPTCSDVAKIAEKNYLESNDTRDVIIGMGYDPCGHCNP